MAAEAGNRGNDRRGSEMEFSETRNQKALYLAEWVEQESMRCVLGIKQRAGPRQITEMLEAEVANEGRPERGTQDERRERGRRYNYRQAATGEVAQRAHGRAESTRSHSCNSTKQWEAEGSRAHPSTARPRAWRWATSKGERGSSHRRSRQTKAEARRTVCCTCVQTTSLQRNASTLGGFSRPFPVRPPSPFRTGLPATTLAQHGVGKNRQRETWQAAVTSMTMPQDADDVDLVSRVVSRGRLSRPSARMLPQ